MESLVLELVRRVMFVCIMTSEWMAAGVNCNFEKNNEINICWECGNRNSSHMERRKLVSQDEVPLMDEAGKFCVVCWDSLNEDEIKKCKDQCNGDFCLDCWNKCMQDSNKCPYCRKQQYIDRQPYFPEHNTRRYVKLCQALAYLIFILLFMSMGDSNDRH